MKTPLYRAGLLLFVTLGLGLAMARADVTGVAKASVSTSGGWTNGDSMWSTVSANGRYVAFESLASNLVPGDTNGVRDIFVRDLLQGTTERISVDSNEAQAISGQSWLAAISADGRFVAFQSRASELVPGGRVNGLDLYVRDRLLGTTERVSLTSAGEAPTTGASILASISADGRYVVFRSHALLVPGDTNGVADIYLRDRVLGTTERVSIGDDESEGNAASWFCKISADGRFVAFDSSATNLVPGDTNATDDVFLRDRVLGTTERVSVDSNGNEVGEIKWEPDVSADGRFVTFYSMSPDLVPGDTNGVRDAFLRDRLLGTTERVAVAADGGEPNGESVARLSTDGRFIGFYSAATNLVPGDVNDEADIFVKDRQSGTIERVSIGFDGAEANSDSGFRMISADGRFVSFDTWATNLVPGDTSSGQSDVFVVERSPYTVNLPPVADAGADREVTTPTVGADSASVTLDGGNSGDPDGLFPVVGPGQQESRPVLIFGWYDGAGNYLGPGPTLNRTLPLGTHTFTLRVTDMFLSSSEDQVTVTVLPKVNQPPVARAGADQQVQVPHDGSAVTSTVMVTLSGATSSDPDGDALTYEWRNSGGTALGTAVTLDRTLAPGTHTFTLRVTDPYGAASEDDVTVTVGPEPNAAPVAAAGPDQQVAPVHDGLPGAPAILVMLTGAGSTDPDGDTVAYQWRNGAGVSIGTTATLNQALLEGTHTFTLRVTDPYGASGEDTVTVTVGPEANAPPVAAAGADPQVPVPHDGNPATSTVSVTLNGSGSTDPDGDALTYQWRNTSGALVGNAATLVRTLAVGSHTFTLIVTDPYGASDSDEVVATVTAEANAVPVADAGLDQQVRVPRDRNPNTQTATVTLSGAASSDADGDALTFRWRDGAGTLVGSQATLIRTHSPGSYTYALTVTDPYGASSQASVSVTVLPEINGGPVANAGPDRQVAPVHDGNPATDTATVTLSGADSTDPDGDPLSYWWRNAAGDPLSASVMLTWGLPVGSHTFTLRVTDPYGASSEDRVTITVQPEPNAVPVARAGADQQVALPHDGNASTQTATVTLNGDGSTDADGDPLAYQWLTPGGSPLGAGATLTRELMAGEHSFVLRVTDPYGAFHEDSVAVTVLAEANLPPVAHAGGNRQVTPVHDGNPATDTALVTLNGGGSTDPDRDPLTYEWRTAGGGVLGTTALSQVPLGPGAHSITLRVTDPYGAAHEDTITLTVAAEPNASPVAAAGPDQNLHLPSGRRAPTTLEVTLSGSGSVDPDGDSLSFEWRDAEGALLADTASVTQTLAPGIYVFRLRVTDPYGAASEDSVNVVVGRATPNRAPRAAAGPDRKLALPHDGSAATDAVSVALNGAGSRDPDGDVLQFTWRDSQGTVVGTTAAIQPTLAAGEHTFTLRVTDPFGASGEDQVTVRVSPERNRAPTAKAGTDQALATGPGGMEAEVTLNASGSRDPDRDALSYAWTGTEGPVATGSNPTLRLPRGRHRLTLTVTDPYGAAAQDVVWITVGVADVTAEVEIVVGRPVTRGRGTQEVRVRVINPSDGAFPAPTSLVMDDLPAGVTLVNAAGSTTSAASPAGSPYLTGRGIAPGRSLQFTLRLKSPTSLTALPGTVRVLAGVGAR